VIGFPVAGGTVYPHVLLAVFFPQVFGRTNERASVSPFYGGTLKVTLGALLGRKISTLVCFKDIESSWRSLDIKGGYQTNVLYGCLVSWLLLLPNQKVKVNHVVVLY
jgi:hypothetical protein